MKPYNKPVSALQMWLDFKGYQGGTIHQAMDEYSKLPIEEKDKFCNILMANLFNCTDMHGLQWFTENRIKHLK